MMDNVHNILNYHILTSSNREQCPLWFVLLVIENPPVAYTMSVSLPPVDRGPEVCLLK